MKISFFYVLLLALVYCSNAQISFEDKIRIREARRISAQLGDSIWVDFNDTPFSILLVTDDFEYLIDHSNPPESFDSLYYDSLLRLNVYLRPTQMNKRFLATFPFEGQSTVVIGTSENTGLNSSDWILTLLHERFHQFQYAAPNYFQDALNLGLSGGDNTGMWQLNYPFPYEVEKINEAYETYTNILYETVKAIGTDDWVKQYKKFRKAKEQFRQSLNEDDYKYLSFQWYQEGTARFTELAFLENLQNYEPASEVQAIDDFIPFAELLPSFFNRHLENVKKMSLEKYKRVTTYDVGMAEVLIIRKVNPNWHTRYRYEKFDLSKFY